MRPRVALLSFEFGEYCIRLASALAEEADVLLLLPSDLAAPYLDKLDSTVDLRTFHKPRLRQPLRQLGMIRTIIYEIRSFKSNLVHLQQGHLWFNLALPALRGIPLVITIHDPRLHAGDRDSRKTPQWIYSFGFRRADQLITHARQLADILISDLRIPVGDIHVVPHIALGDEPASVAEQPDKPVILFFGRIWEYKGLEYLIRAEPLITSQIPDARIVIAGEGEHFERYRHMMIHPDHFEVLNEYVPDDQIASLFSNASVVALPYIEASQSGVIPIAFTFSRAVVATPVGGLPDLIKHEETGLLVPPRDEKALADAIVRLLQDAELRTRLGSNGNRRMRLEYSARPVAKQTLEVYSKALSANPN
jgi:glycosyltransferase involved in cell wall biosynthesis